MADYWKRAIVSTMILSEIAVGGGSGMLHGLLIFLLVGICVAAIWWVGTWFISKLALPVMAGTIWAGLFVLVGLIVLINFVMGLAGKPLFSW